MIISAQHYGVTFPERAQTHSTKTNSHGEIFVVISEFQPVRGSNSVDSQDKLKQTKREKKGTTTKPIKIKEKAKRNKKEKVTGEG